MRMLYSSFLAVALAIKTDQGILMPYAHDPDMYIKNEKRIDILSFLCIFRSNQGGSWSYARASG